MPVKVTVESVLAGKDAFEAAKRNAEELNKNLRGQFAERERIIKLQARLSQTTDRQQKAAIRAEIAERRRGLQLVALKEREERAVTKELKDQISQQRRLNSLTERLNKDLAKQQQQRSLLGRAQAAVGGAGGALALGGAAIAGKQLLDFQREAVELAKVQAQAEAQLEARLRSTGGAAGLSAQELKDYAAELQGVTNISDESTIAAEAMLLSFTNIGKETFPRATKAILDTATAMNNGATPSAEQLRDRAIAIGKALNDPITQLGALTRNGIVFTEQQKEQIKAMAEAGDVAGAQAAILAELEKEFGGSAEAARKADQGAQALANSWGDLKEQIGGLTQISSVQNEALITLTDSITGLLKKVREYREIGLALTEIENENASTTDKLTDGYLQYIPIVGNLISLTRPLLASDEELTAAQKKLADEQAAAGRTANEMAEALEDSGDAADDAAKKQEEAAKRLEHVQSVQRDFAKSLLDISERAQKDSAEQWKDYYSDLADLTDDYGDRVADLEEKAGKDRLSIAKKLAKDLAKTDHDLNRDREKITADTDKKIKRLKEDAAREQKQDRRKRQIDTAGDERLFNFELQQLAAEGEALQIQEAQKRREIEKQINAEKQQEDAQQESSDLDLKIQRLKEDAQDRLREEEAQARERREFLKTQAEEDRQQLAEDLQERKDAEFENLQERLDKLKESNAEKLRNIEETRIKANQKLGEELAEAKDLTESELEALKPIAGRLGEDIGGEFAQGLNRGFETNEKINQLLGRTKGGFSGGAQAGFGATPGSLRHFQHGGDFRAFEPIRVGETGPETVAFNRPGTVIPNGQAGGGINITIPISGIGGGVTEAKVEAIAQRHAQNLVNELEQMISS